MSAAHIFAWAYIGLVGLVLTGLASLGLSLCLRLWWEAMKAIWS